MLKKKNSRCQHFKKGKENGMKIMHNDVGL